MGAFLRPPLDAGNTPDNMSAFFIRVKYMATYTVFAGHRRLLTGGLADVAQLVKAQVHGPLPLLVFDDASGQTVEIDPLGNLVCDVPSAAAPRGPGRPRLGVTAREVTLLPRHWDWLGEQPGGASAVLRRLVEEAMRDGSALRRRQAEAADRCMRTLAGDLAGYEEASRALWRGDAVRFATMIAAWPHDVREHLHRLTTLLWAGESSTLPA